MLAARLRLLGGVTVLLKQQLIASRLDNSQHAPHVPHVVFENAEFHKQFGLPRSQVDYMEALGTLTEEARHRRQKWLLQISQVSYKVVQ